MKRKQFSEEQIIGILKEAEAGPPAPEAATPPLPASGSASLHLRPAMAAETTMH